MDSREKDDLYSDIDSNDDMTDSEKRDAYFSEIDEREQEEQWQNGFN